MNIDKDKLIEMAEDAGLKKQYDDYFGDIENLTKFADLVSAHAITSMQTEQLSLSTIEKVKSALTNAGIATGDDSLEGFAARIEYHVLTLCRHVLRKPAPVSSMQGDSEYSLVRNDVLAFLHGEGDIDGVGFGDVISAPQTMRQAGKYWWRTYLRQATKPIGQLSTNTDGWVSVDTDLPKLVKSDNHETEPMLESERVLTYSNSGYGLDKVYKIGEGKTHFFSEKATHWQPLPAPPAISQDKGE